MVLTLALKQSLLLSTPAAEYLEYRSFIQRNYKQVAVWTSLNVGADAEVSPDKQALALGNVELAVVIGNAIFKTRVVDADFSSVAG